MKITLQQIDEGSEEVIIKYRQMTERITGIVKYLEERGNGSLEKRRERSLSSM